jgi:hypothetical protein
MIYNVCKFYVDLCDYMIKLKVLRSLDRLPNQHL